jgi:hypothetical protein
VLVVPSVALPPVTPFTFQMTDLFDVFWTVAVNCTERLIRTDAVVGEIAIVTAAGATTLT